MSSSNSFLLSSAFSVGLKGIYAVVSFLSSVILARTLSPEFFGIYSWCLALLVILVLPVSAGMPEFLVRETAKLFKNKMLEDISFIWLRAFRRTFYLSSIILAIIVVVSGWFIYSSNYENYKSIGMLCLAFSVPFIASTAITSAMLRGTGKVILGLIADSLLRPVFILFAAIFLSIMVDNPNSNDALLFYFFATILACLINYVLFLKCSPVRLLYKKRSNLALGSLTKAILPLSMIAGLQVIISFTDILLIGLFLENSDVGIYKVALQFSVIVSFGLQSINQVLQPRISALYSVGEISELQHIVARSALVIFVISLPVALFLFFYSTILIDYIYGVEYTEGALALTILAASQMINASFGSVGSLLNMAGKEVYTLKGLILAAFTNVLLGLLLIPIWGIEGAAVSSVVSMIIWNFLLRKYVKKIMKIEPSIISGIKLILLKRTP